MSRPGELTHAMETTKTKALERREAEEKSFAEEVRAVLTCLNFHLFFSIFLSISRNVDP